MFLRTNIAHPASICEFTFSRRAGFLMPYHIIVSFVSWFTVTANSTQQERDMLKDEAYNRLNEVGIFHPVI